MLAAQDYFQITCTSLNKEILAHPSFLHGPRKRLHFAFTIPKQTNGSTFILVFKRKNKVSWSSFFFFCFLRSILCSDEIYPNKVTNIRIQWKFKSSGMAYIIYMGSIKYIFVCVYIYIYMLYNILFSILLFHSCLVGV